MGSPDQEVSRPGISQTRGVPRPEGSPDQRGPLILSEAALWAKAGLWSCCFWEPLLLILSICDKFFKPKNQSNPILHGLFPIPYYMGGVIHPPPAKSLEDAPNGLFFDDYVPRNI